MDWPPYAPTALRADSVREFCDWNFLSRRALDSRAAALDYFCLSPFYAEVRDNSSSGENSVSSLTSRSQTSSTRLLNERIRMGESLNLAVAEGLLFRVVEDNLDKILPLAPPDPSPTDSTSHSSLSTAEEEGAAAAALAARRQYFATKALFVLSLFELRLSVHGMQQQQPLRAYAVVGGRVYRLPPLIQAVMQRVGEAASHLSACGQLLLLQLCRWNVSCGYTWQAPLQKQALDFASEAAEKYVENKPTQTDHALQTKRPTEKYQYYESKVSDRVEVVYCKPQCSAAVRVLTEESQRLAAQHKVLQERRNSLEGLWRGAVEQQAEFHSQLQILQNKVAELRAALLQQSTDPRQAAALLEKLEAARVSSVDTP